MEQQPRNDLNISGIGRTGGGCYKNVRIDGVGKVGGDIDCLKFICNGTVGIEGSLHAESMNINGTAKVEGAVTLDEMVIGGMATFKDEVHCRSVAINGRASMDKSLKSDRVEVGGTLKAKGDVQCEAFSVKGQFTIDGLLNADQVDIKLNLPCSAHEIGGEHIVVRKWKNLRFWEQLQFGFSARLKAHMIEGDQVDLEHTEADTVRGNDVSIGPGCTIRLVEYKNTIHRDPEAKIGSCVRI
ncbi:polymer-forming cytoskeletal protein [Paenibacillus sp. FA6]|uniref:polymer-forming cytoskeletal protein n=1 Tax=Paenibacillus sp. FA6 TaxID=3413029 RepID=UPI003F65B959